MLKTLVLLIFTSSHKLGKPDFFCSPQRQYLGKKKGEGGLASLPCSSPRPGGKFMSFHEENFKLLNRSVVRKS